MTHLFPRTALLTSLTMTMVMAQSVLAQSAGSDMTLILAPHCTNADRVTCPTFTVANADHLKTDTLAAGDILDLDIVVSGPKFADVETIESWLKYDPSILEARSVESTQAINAPTPGEQTIDAAQGIVKIGGGTKGMLKANQTAIARVTFRVVASTNNTEISFYGYKVDGTGQTTVNAAFGRKEENGGLPAAPCFGDIIGCRGAPNPLMSTHPSALTVILVNPNAAAASSQPGADTTAVLPSAAAAESNTVPMQTTSETPAAIPTANTTGATTFTTLQIQGLKVTTKDTAAYLAWMALRSAETVGYNVYYGTVSGRYIQRRSVPSADTSLSIRDLAPGMTYYFAVRGVNAKDQESVFSQEVSVAIGKPETSTSPMAATIIAPTPVDGNPVVNHQGTVIQGETGIGSSMLMLAMIAAITGTAFAFRRQLTLMHSSHHAI